MCVVGLSGVINDVLNPFYLGNKYRAYLNSPVNGTSDYINAVCVNVSVPYASVTVVFMEEMYSGPYILYYIILYYIILYYIILYYIILFYIISYHIIYHIISYYIIYNRGINVVTKSSTTPKNLFHRNIKRTTKCAQYLIYIKHMISCPLSRN